MDSFFVLNQIHIPTKVVHLQKNYCGRNSR